MNKNILKKLRFKWFLASRTLGYTEDYLQRVYQIYLNHHKIIHYRDGFPVYSLSTPAIFTKPAANMLARSIYSGIQNRQFPNLMSFAVNDSCNANCSHCSFFDRVEDKKRTVLTLDQCRQAIKAGQDLGVSVINFVGGEPLLRLDFLEVIRSVNKDLSTSVVFTNGSRLAEMAAALKKAGLDSVYVSIDGSSAEIHDRKRGKKGIFDLALSGIKAAQKAGLTVGTSACITKEDFISGEAVKLIEFGKKMGIHEVLFFDAKPVGRCAHHQNPSDSRAWVDDLIVLSEKYNQDESYPGVLIYAYATSYKSTGCSGGVSYFYISPYGDVSPCDFNSLYFGNVLETPLYLIWDKMTKTEIFRQASWDGCKMKHGS